MPAANFKPLIFSVWGLALSNVTNIFIFMILDDFCLFNTNREENAAFKLMHICILWACMPSRSLETAGFTFLLLASLQLFMKYVPHS
jgi:hypothetical protein